jgi:hypothetical protein
MHLSAKPQAIMSVGYEPDLLRLRSLLLRRCLGVEVLEAPDLLTAMQIARREHGLYLLVLCHTVPTDDQRLIIDTATRRFGHISAFSVFVGLCPGSLPGKPVSCDPDRLVGAVLKELQKEGSALPYQDREHKIFRPAQLQLQAAEYYSPGVTGAKKHYDRNWERLASEAD